jgi:hypothetical protein
VVDGLLLSRPESLTPVRRRQEGVDVENEISKVRAQVRDLIETEQRLHDALRQLAAQETEGTVEWLTPPLERAITELELGRDKLEAAYDRLGDAISAEADS